MLITVNVLVRHFVLGSVIAGSIGVSGKSAFLEVLFPIKEKEHSLIYPVVGKMVSAVRTEDNYIFAAPLHKAVGYCNVSRNLFFVNHIKPSLADHSCRHRDFSFLRW